ncbi:uncharacterized protein DUF2059 [Pacificibacter maritimus]|uniref:Uncharacterized protein DUF2059 n=1 Tax=Pacificibacter maritimus TaxID=762213 RepID=A0A3N4VC58_9RHOB|nr:DUF2059 domain-containing protein [Pacificibacter maritimus]RPE71410.1 uncharacterized protein DUF2059 [Pacificibacter maritimus]
MAYLNFSVLKSIASGPVLRAMLLAPVALVFSLSSAVSAPVDRLMDLMKFRDVIAVLSEEGRSMSDDISDEELGIPRAAWDEMMTRLYDEERLEVAFRGALVDAFGDADLGPAVAFFETDLGQEIAELELNARRAIGDEAVLQAAGDLWAELDPSSERSSLIESYVNTNDLIEMNIIGSLNSDMAYYRGFNAQALDGMGVDEATIMREVWAGEPEARARVTEWVYGFSALAYQPLSDEDFATYVDFGKSETGQTLNLAMFAAFDSVYADLARGLGAGTAVLAQSSAGQDL